MTRKNQIHIITFVLTVSVTVLIVILLTVGVIGDDDHGGIFKSGEFGENITWTLYKDGLLRISGTGEMGINRPPWLYSADVIKSLQLDEGMTSIIHGAFYECSGITGEVSIPDSATSIEGSAFFWCTGITSVNIGNNVTHIEQAAFCGCSGITELSIPDSVTSIGIGVFEDCSGLTSVKIGSSVSLIEKTAFYNCNSLNSVYFEGNAPTIETDVFYGCPDDMIVYCHKKYSNSFFTYGGKWKGFKLVILDDDDVVSADNSISVTGAVLDVGSTIQLTASADDTIIWASSNPAVASVVNGAVTALSEGTTTIIAMTTSGGSAVSFQVMVNPAPNPIINGDFDGDGQITAADRMILSRYLAGWQEYTKYFEP